MVSKRRIRRRQCSGKAKHDEQGARYAAALGRKATGDNIQPYRCRFCHGYHIGHPPARVKQAMTARRK